MGLRELAASDLVAILEDDEFGFAVDITLTDPDGDTQELKGFSNDITQIIDPETNQIITGRLATATLPLSSITLSGVPEGIADASKKPWLVAFDDILGESYLFKVAKASPDRTLGVIFLVLELYTP